MLWYSCAGALVALAALASCSDDCNAMGCGPSLCVEIHREIWEPGSWQVDVGQDGSCAWTIPASEAQDPGQLGEGEQPDCWVWSEAPEVTVSLFRDGALIGSQTIYPKYRKSGDECLTCSVANEIVEF